MRTMTPTGFYNSGPLERAVAAFGGVATTALVCAALVFPLEARGIGGGQAPGSFPVCAHNGPYVAECNGQFTSVPVTSTGSFDPDGTAIAVLWFEECPWGFFDDPTSPAPNLVIDMGLNCTRDCFFALRIFSGGEMTACTSTVTSQDTTAPAITTVADITDIWGIPTDVGSTGSPTATDACDPTPSVSMIDEIVLPSTGPGHEGTIERTWQALDNCGHQATTHQRITLLSPLAHGSNLEVDINECDDVFDRGDTSSTFEVVLLGRLGLNISQMQLGTLKLSRLGDQSNFVWPANPQLYQPSDVAMQIATHVGDCNPPGTDGRMDLRLQFDRPTVRAALDLDTPPVDSIVYIAITGKRLNGTSFIAGAKMRLH